MSTIKYVTLLFFILFLKQETVGQSNLKLKITPLTDNFYIYTTYNDYKGTLVPANGLYLVTANGVVMIDTPWDTTQFEPLLDSIKTRHHQNIIMCIATHSHEDRTGGLEYYRKQGIKTYTTVQTDEISKASNKKRAEFLILNDTLYTIGGYSFQTYYGGAGHAPDNIVIWFDKDKILYGGCLIKSVEANDLGNLGDADVHQWPATIKNIQKKFVKPEYIIPGHGDWTSKKSIAHTLHLLKEHLAK
ncbi:MAG: BlaB/IND/MUS family subclass B1 metallo-beta-lactamase [Bacteroidota bacterium]